MVKIALIGIVAAIMANFFKGNKDEYSIYISLASSILIFYLGFGKLEVILNTIEKLQSYIKINQSYMNILFKIIGITYVTELSASICKDFGYSSISNQVELIGKLTILAISMPILLTLLDTINLFLSWKLAFLLNGVNASEWGILWENT